MSDDERLYTITIEKCSTQRTKYFFNSKVYRIAPEALKTLFDLKSSEMNKLSLGYPVHRKYSKHDLDEKFKELERLKNLTIS
jgi:hypothetical protein